MSISVAAVFLLTSIATIAVTFAFILYQRSIGNRNLLSPGIFAMLLFITQYGIGNYFVIVQGKIDFPQLEGRDDVLAKTFLLALSAQVAFVVGYILKRGFRPSPVARIVPTRPFVWAIIAAYGLGIAARLIMIRMGVYSYLLSNLETFQSELGLVMVLTKLERLCTYALVAGLIATYLNPEQRAYRTSTGLMLVTEVALNFIGGTKGALLIILLYVGLVAWTVRGRVPARWLLVGVIAWMFFTPWNLAYRLRIIRGLVVPTDVWSVTKGAGAAFIDAFAPATAASSPSAAFLENVQARLPMIQPAAMVVDYADVNPKPVMLSTYLMLPLTAVIPRIIWPSKPVDFTGKWVAAELYGDVDSNTAVSITGIGFLYMEFGLPGPFFGFLLWGALFAVIERRAGRTAGGLLLIAALYPSLINIGVADMTGLLSGMVKDVMVLLPFAWVAGFLSRSRPRPTAIEGNVPSPALA